MMRMVLCAVLGIALIAGGSLMFSDHTIADEFDAEVWKAAKGADPKTTPRKAMRRDVERLIKPGMAEAEIIALLGAPDGRRENRLVWEAGTNLVDFYEFVVILGSDGTVEEAYLSQG